MKTTDITYLNGLLEWSNITNGADKTKEIIESDGGILSLMKSYNEAYLDFYNKVSNLSQYELRALHIGMAGDLYVQLTIQNANDRFNNSIENFHK